MSVPVVIHGDDERAVIERVQAIWAAPGPAALPYAPASDAIGVEIPLTLTGSTAIQVNREAPVSLRTYPFRDQAQVRVTCWAPSDKRTWVKALAKRTLAELIATDPDAPGADQELGWITGQIGCSSVITDPDTKNLAVWFLVTASLRGQQL